MTEINISEKDAALLFELQQGLPLERSPFAVIGARLGMTEDAVLSAVGKFLDKGLARTLCAIFDTRRLGYRSALCAVSADADELARFAPQLVSHPGITHCYLRRAIRSEITGRNRGPRTIPNLWFTITIRARDYADELRALRKTTAPARMLVLPARRLFKIGMILHPRPDPKTDSRRVTRPSSAAVVAPAQKPIRLTASQQALISRLRESLPLTVKPFDLVAREAGCKPDDVLRQLKRWRKSGALRRVALVASPRRLGFTANAMCVWSAPRERVMRAGRILAQCGYVTHCYERASATAFPYNLYAVIHCRNVRKLKRVFETLTIRTGLKNGLILMSTRELRRESPPLFFDLNFARLRAQFTM